MKRKSFCRFNFLCLFFLLFLASSCSKEPVIDNETMLDGDEIFDTTLHRPEIFLTSYRYKKPTEELLNKPVVIACHGYSATTFEWLEFYNWSDTNNYNVSLVLLGGHGRTYGDFKASSWEDWQASILEEYTRLNEQGYTDISFVGSSTACPLMLNLFYENKLDQTNYPKNVIFIDPIVVASNKTLSLVKGVGPMLGYVTDNLKPKEEGYWYRYRPQESLQELQEILVLTRKELQAGVVLPNETYMHIFKVEKDPSADPVGVALLYNGLKYKNGSAVDITMVESQFHVFTCLSRWDAVSEKDRQNQAMAFEFIQKMLID